MEKLEIWQSLLREAEGSKASDIHCTAGQPAFFRVNGRLAALGSHILTETEFSAMLHQVIHAREWQRLELEKSLDISWQWQGQRFRVNAYFQCGRPALAMRLIPQTIPSLSKLGAPEALQRALALRHGLLLVCGRTGQGKTTTLAAFLNELNQREAGHIITLEDPIEYLYPLGKGFVSQRELGMDFQSFSSALRGALREDPDVILIGELRDADTARIALWAAEAGFLVLSSLHTESAAEAALRLESLFPAEEQARIRGQFAAVVAGIFSQRLLPASRGGRLCATEVMIATTAVRSLIRQGKYAQLPSAILSGGKWGMQTMAKAMEALQGEVCQ